MVDVDVRILHSQSKQRLALDRQILIRGRTLA